MVLEADRAGCLGEMLVVAAALSIQDPRERPVDRQERAQQLHARFADPGSDFVTYLNLWRYLREQQKALSSSAFRRLCQAEMLHYLRIREWQDLVSQLRRVAKDIGLSVPSGPAARPRPTPPGCTRPCWPGCSRTSGCATASAATTSARGAPASSSGRGPRSLGGRRPGWSPPSSWRPRGCSAGSLPGSSRPGSSRWPPTWCRAATASRTGRPGAARSWPYERVTLYGLPLVVGRRVTYGAIDPELSRELFIRHALVGGEWTAHHRFVRVNAARVEEVERLEARVRQRGLLADEEARFAFFDARIPADVRLPAPLRPMVEARVRRDQPDLLTFDDSVLLRPEAGAVSEEAFPATWRAGGVELPLTYEFDPGSTRRRRHGPRAARRAGPPGPRAVQLAGARACARSS